MLLHHSRLHPTRIAELVLWSTGAFGAAAAVVAWTARPAPPSGPAVPDVVRPAPAEYRDHPDAVLAAASVLADQDPFRVTRRPALVAFGAPAPAAGAAGPLMNGFVAPPPIAPRPRLTVLGIVGGGGRWEAVLAGIVGRDGGALVRAGDTLGGLRIRRVTADSLVVQEIRPGRDTVWRLTLGPAVPSGRALAGTRP